MYKKKVIELQRAIVNTVIYKVFTYSKRSGYISKLYLPSKSSLNIIAQSALEWGRFSTRNNFHSEVLRRNEVFVLTCVDRIIFPSENCSTPAK